MEEVRTKWLKRAKLRAKAPSRVRMLLWALLIALLVGLLGAGAPFDGMMRTARNTLAKQPASGSIVVVAIDDKSLQQLSQWPWPRGIHAKIAENLDRLGARDIVFDIDFSSHSVPSQDLALERAFTRLGRKVTLPVQVVPDPVTGDRTDVIPLPRFAKNVELANINFWYNRAGQVWKIPYSFEVGQRLHPTFAAKMAGKSGPHDREFNVDYSIDPTTIPRISAVDAFRGKVARDAVAGRTVIIGATSRQLGDTYVLPGYGVLSGVFIHVVGAETLKAGTPVDLGWTGGLLLTALLCSAAIYAKRYWVSFTCLAIGFAACLAAPYWLERQLMFVDVMPSLTLVLIVAGRLAWTMFRTSYQARGITNAVSGLPNLAALRQEDLGHSKPMVAARVQNYAEVVATLSLEDERLMIEQVSMRLRLGSPQTKLYQGDEGIFVWFADEEQDSDLGEHLEALFEMFRSPVRVHDRQLDLTITFGVDRDPSRSIPNRLGSALVAADEALRDSLRWKEYDPAKLKDAEWKLSLLSQLDEAMEAGHLWVAYQPKLDLASGDIVGAEALARWTHPEKGPISPADFVLAAEQSGRIERLTSYVLERAISAAAELHQVRPRFNVAVNLSARLIGDLSLTETIEQLLARHGLPAECLTLEITETAALGGNSTGIETLHKLGALGVQLSIDDYGTGLSTLNYLKRIPANEIKIDKSFVQGIEDNQSDKVMVHSTIQLAHSLGRKVVAEGVEQKRTLDLLAAMGCDIVQGYLVGAPMSLQMLTERLAMPEVEARRLRQA